MSHRRARSRSARRALTAVTAVLSAGALAVGVAGPSEASPVPAAAAGQPARQRAGALDPSQFQGVNWADPRDNYVSGPVIPSGLSTDDDYATTHAKSLAVLKGFRKNVGANTVRLPVNPYSVGPNSAWWRSYRATIDAATELGFNVVLSYWEGADTEKDGVVDDPAAWWSMWDTLTRTFRADPNVRFEPMNEPFGYSEVQWVPLVEQWLARYDRIPRNRVFVSGTGYNDHVNALCGYRSLRGTYLSLHDYGYWATQTYAEWLDDFGNRIGGCASRTVLDEFGSPMTTGIDYTASSTASDPDTNNSVAYLQAATDTVRRLHMGAIYWPGLRTGDTYSMETLSGTGTYLRLTTNNPSGAALLRWAWGYGTTAPHPVP